MPRSTDAAEQSPTVTEQEDPAPAFLVDVGVREPTQSGTSWSPHAGRFPRPQAVTDRTRERATSQH